jgi:twitching motility protein PilT
MVELINDNYDVKVITVEDPIEFIHGERRALISQIEVGSDSVSFEQALRQALRQDPDVILIGELRDIETLRMALRAADTGHQVFATVHASRAAQTIERMTAMFPADEQKVLLSQLAQSLEAIISQRLVVTRDGQGRRPAIEILRGGPVTERFILEGKLAELTEYVQTGESGMQSFDQHLLRMFQERLITSKEALRHANRPEALATAMHGITHSGT